MNHCIDCGRPINTGRKTSFTCHNAVRCLICETARTMRSFHYVSPATRRWQARKEQSR